MEIDYSVTAVEDNTGRRIKLAEKKLEDCFLLVYCDNYWPMQMDRMWRRFVEAGAPAMLTVYCQQGQLHEAHVEAGCRGLRGDL